MKKIFLAMVLVAVVIMVTACGGTTTTEGEDVTVTTSGDIDYSGDWCAEGNWKQIVEGADTTSETTVTIDKIITGGQFDGLCHILLTFKNPEGDMIWDYYINEDGTEGYLEMEINGQKTTTEWHD